MEKHARKQIMERLTAPDTCYLLGAGCSKCAGKPLIDGLTKSVMADADCELSTLFKTLKTVDSRRPTVEDLINCLLRYGDFLAISDAAITNIDTRQIEKWIRYIRKTIVKIIADDWTSSEYHRRCFSRLKQSNRPRDIFSLNYDTVIESSLDGECLSYTDGFRGSNWAWFDPEVFDESSTSFRIFKLHGSVNWIRDEGQIIRRTAKRQDKPVLVYPSEQKYIETKFGIYEELMMKFRNRLRKKKQNNCLVTLGYSFNDAHINEAICDSVVARDSYLTVIAFIGPESDLAQQTARINSLAERCDSRFNAFIGGEKEGEMIGQLISTPASQHVLGAELWQFEHFVDLLDGGVL